MKRLLLIVILLSMPAFADDIKASYSNSSFEKIFQVDKVQAIEMWEQPKTAYTPKNLRTEQQMRFNGRTSTGVASYTLHLTDYDTKIVKSYFKDGKFYIEDNTGKTFLTGVDNSQDIQRIDNQVQDNRVQIKNNTQNINAIKNDVSQLNSRVNDIQAQVDKLDNKLEKGLATVTALTALHPNPRHKGRTQISVGAGMYADNVAGAIGIFHWLTDRIMLSAGASYGGDDSFAGNVGITIGF